MILLTDSSATRLDGAKAGQSLKINNNDILKDIGIVILNSATIVGVTSGLVYLSGKAPAALINTAGLTAANVAIKITIAKFIISSMDQTADLSELDSTVAIAHKVSRLLSGSTMVKLYEALSISDQNQISIDSTNIGVIVEILTGLNSQDPHVRSISVARAIGYISTQISTFSSTHIDSDKVGGLANESYSFKHEGPRESENTGRITKDDSGNYRYEGKYFDIEANE
ncbi:MAG: hypothetical protein AB2689_25730 [Candidatus Thiodiazotropha taylori]|nr:hypothetical protein [Candidatus Thiodiazotropha taylori]MCW4315763.1 hypothetical protein [Candidatus Thiodiazotropha taylori]